jgi:hypothetical protein
MCEKKISSGTQVHVQLGGLATGSPQNRTVLSTFISPDQYCNIPAALSENSSPSLRSCVSWYIMSVGFLASGHVHSKTRWPYFHTIFNVFSVHNS